MKSVTITRFFITNLAIVIFLGLVQVQAQAVKTVKTSSTIDKFSDTHKKAIENIVRDYLLKNPSIIREATQALQLQEAKEKQELTAGNLKRLEKEIFSDANSPTEGNIKADVSIVVFFDYNCHYCKSSLPGLKELSANDPSIQIIYKEYPILSESSQLAARAALAANRQGKYIEFHDALLGAQEINDGAIERIAKRIGVNFETLQKDMNDEKINGYISDNYKLANALNINGTPAYIVGNRVIYGAIDMGSLARIVSNERAKLVDSKVVAKSIGAVK